MDWVHTMSIIATVVASAYYIHRDINADMKSQTARTDKLYEMFIDLIKEGKK
jgi:hypothetical protein